MTTTTFQIDLHFQKVTTAEEILGTLYTQTSTAIDAHNLVDAYCYMFIPVSKRSKVFAKVEIDALTSDVRYFVKHNPKTGNYLPAMDYTQAIRSLRSLLA